MKGLYASRYKGKVVLETAEQRAQSRALRDISLGEPAASLSKASGNRGGRCERREMPKKAQSTAFLVERLKLATLGRCLPARFSKKLSLDTGRARWGSPGVPGGGQGVS